VFGMESAVVLRIQVLCEGQCTTEGVTTDGAGLFGHVDFVGTGLMSSACSRNAI